MHKCKDTTGQSSFAPYKCKETWIKVLFSRHLLPRYEQGGKFSGWPLSITKDNNVLKRYEQERKCLVWPHFLTKDNNANKRYESRGNIQGGHTF